MFLDRVERITFWLGVALLALLFWVAMNYSSLNMGGSGVQVPYNLFAWLACSLFIAVAIVRVIVLRIVWFHSTTLYYAIALTLLFAPLLWTNRLFLDVELLRFLGMFAGVLFFFALQQFMVRDFVNLALLILLASTLIQTFWGILQYYFIFERSALFWSASAGRPYGVFQQVNVFSIYLALGSLLMLNRVSLLRTKPVWLLVFASSVLLANAHLTVLSEADTARAVAFVSAFGYLVFLWSASRLSKKSVLIFATMLIIGTFSPKAWFEIRPDQITEQTSSGGVSADIFAATSQLSTNLDESAGATPTQSKFGTRPTIYAVALEMFFDKPLVGHGVGSFRKQYLLYQGDYLRRYPAAPAEINIGHPHNELLYWAVELGLIPLFGFLLILIAWVVSVRRRALDASILLVGTPLLLQTMLELPFYHSTVHYLGAMVVLVAAMSPSGLKSFRIPVWQIPVLAGLTLWSLWKTWVFLLSTYFALTMFLLFNASGRNDISYLLDINNPSAFKLRHEFEIFQWKFRRAKESGEMSLEDVNNYLRWAFSTVQYAPMQSTYENFVASLVLVDKKKPARRYLDEGLLMYPGSAKLKAFDQQLATMESGGE